MRGSYTNFLINTSRKSVAVERALAEDKEAAELRLARIQNGKHPDYRNGPWEQAQEIASVSKDTRLAGSPRKAAK